MASACDQVDPPLDFRTLALHRPLIDARYLAFATLLSYPFTHLCMPFLNCCYFFSAVIRRSACPLCAKSVLLYCYHCFVPVYAPSLAPPPLDLPLHIHILHHPNEHLTKATGIHAKVLCPTQVTWTHLGQVPLDAPLFPGPPGSTVLLFPSADATSVHDLRDDQLATIRSAVFIDSTWQQARSVWSDPRVAALPKVAIPAQQTKFWRVSCSFF